jgi:hypothetical protein
VRGSACRPTGSQHSSSTFAPATDARRVAPSAAQLGSADARVRRRGRPPCSVPGERVSSTPASRRQRRRYRAPLQAAPLDFAWRAASGVGGARAFTLGSAERFSDTYPGGWQEVLPNGGTRHVAFGLRRSSSRGAGATAGRVEAILTRAVNEAAGASAQVAAAARRGRDRRRSLDVIPERGAPSEPLPDGLHRGTVRILRAAEQSGLRVEWDASVSPRLVLAGVRAHDRLPLVPPPLQRGSRAVHELPDERSRRGRRERLGAELPPRARRDFWLTATVVDG